MSITILYGYVTPEDVPELLDQHVAKGEIIERLWRGQLGVAAEDGEKANDQRLPNGVVVDKSRKDQESGSQDTKESFAGCCQGANGGVTCCRDASLEQNDKSEEKNLEACSKEGPLCKLSSWIGTLEQRDVLATAAVVGAVATVAVAYSYYRRSH
ncbi:Thioredoxin-like fold containing protein [Trema orientale]|uniref:Thioredoxin-like fold containing protein n=1 Tax=Trema orientale TaxID=63057 RepID=A0A2P5BFP6_TREOI|nr:Thioredoxin-like fold containing protein [Trema orientale]